MSRLEELIAELCPNGVEYRSIASLITRVRERGKEDTTVSQVYVVSNEQGIVRSEDYHENEIHSENTSNYTIIRQGMFAYNPSRLNIGSLGLLQFTEPGLVSPMYVVFSIKRNLIAKDFLLLYLKSSYVKNRIDTLKEEGARFRFDFARWDKIDIPLPPLPVQEEIVRILDNFTELTAELTARKKQYEYYRDEFYGHDYEGMLKMADNQSVKILPLSEVGTLKRGKRFVKADSEGLMSGVPCLHYGELYTYYGVSAEKPKSFVKSELAAKLRFASKGDVVIVGAGENNIDIGVGVAWFGDEDIAVHDACYTLTHNQNPKYISYYLRTNIYHSQIKKYVSEGKICSISASGLGKALIPIPSIEEQDRIVSILDKFDILTTDISAGLPAEIEARQKQYEYYRDKLLTFKELS